MAHGRGALVVALLLLPLAAPPAAAEVTYTYQALNATFQPTLEFHLGDLVRLRLVVKNVDESVTVYKSMRLLREGVLRETIGDGSEVSPPQGTSATITLDWPTNHLAASDFGRWRAEIDTPHGTKRVGFDLDHAPDLAFTHVDVQHPPFSVPWPFARDGTTKIVRGCLVNQGPDTSLGSARVELYYRTHADPALWGGLQDPRVATPDWREGHAVAAQDVFFGYPTPTCVEKNLNHPGRYVEFTWSTTSKMEELSVALYMVGLRADPQNAVWETKEGNNERQVQTSSQPVEWIP